MNEITINLTGHKFSDGIKLFKQSEVKLKHKNFIFAKNGSGKSTFSSIIGRQCSEDYDVRIYNGFDTMLGENENLNAFALSVNASENEALIKEKQKSLNEKRIELNRILLEIGDISTESEERTNLSKDFQNAKNLVAKKRKVIEDFYTESASIIKNMSNPQISGTAYNKNNFKNEMHSSIKLQDYEISRFSETLKTDKKIARKIVLRGMNLTGYLNSTNEILESEVKERNKILRFNDDQNKINFAERGLKIHKHEEGELCAFCGNPISKETFAELDSYFSADEVKELKNRISVGKSKIADLVTQLNSIDVGKLNFYPDFCKQADEEFHKIGLQREKLIRFCETLRASLDDKERNLFGKQEPISIEVPDNINVLEYNSLVEKNNIFGENIDKEKSLLKSKLRGNAIKDMLEKFHFEKKEMELKSAQKQQDNVHDEINRKEAERDALQKVIKFLEDEIDSLKPKAEEQAIKNINKKLRGAVSWQLDYYEEDNQSGYYWVSQKCQNGSIVHRGVKELSTGEKNIIALLYFLEKLEENTSKKVTNRKRMSKIILFDDPMNSNDAGMQYLIITELQKLYRGKMPHRYDPQKDYIVIMTHNVHFYLNVPPMGSYKDTNQKTKYDKNNFYYISQGCFHKISNEKQDFKTNYDALWSELQDLCENKLTNSMLNSMRRIIETYISFNGIKQDDFYQDNEQYLKLFNVNSHSAIDDLSTEAFDETPEELVNSFHQIFKDNDAEDHFRLHWQEYKADRV